MALNCLDLLPGCLQISKVSAYPCQFNTFQYPNLLFSFEVFQLEVLVTVLDGGIEQVTLGVSETAQFIAVLAKAKPTVQDFTILVDDIRRFGEWKIIVFISNLTRAAHL